MRLPAKEDAAYPLLARLIFWAQKKKYGESLHSSKVWGRSPWLLYGLQTLYRALDRKSSPLEASLRALIGLRVSQITHCSFCVDIGEALLKKHGITPDKIFALAQHEGNPLFSDRERAALAYAEAMTLAGSGVDQALFERVRAHFSEEAVVELTAAIAYQNMTSRFNAALDVPSQGFCVKMLPPCGRV